YGGIILNRSTEIVDKVRETVFQGETFKGQSIGTATIFIKDLRASTNVITEKGNRAIGTQISGEVYQKVLIEGESWIDRAFVVNDWYITAYEPIRDIRNNISGILSVGVLEIKYTELKRKTLLVFIGITVTGLIIAVLLGYLLAKRVLQPVYDLIEVSKKVSGGDLSPAIGKISKGEIGTLQQTFMEMTSALRERDIHQKEESENRLMISEKQASVGRLAAGVAHEINNPLTGVLTFTHMLLRRKDLDTEMRNDLETIAMATNRVREIVKGLLDFSRQIKLKLEPSDINKVIKDTLSLIENQALVKRVYFCFDPGIDIPIKTLDRSQFQSVIMNIIINAIDATDSGGYITISTRINFETQFGRHKKIEIIITDSGCGIPPEQLDKLFDPFYTTKEVGQGTGLGLSVSLGIIEHHGGTISVKSQVGKGSTFIIHLPLDGYDE
ncbi:MAG: cache domain-containing protein, partial [Spirochaetales bacterium]|nr:cache domain-containing protein [Spirochaetales bacterium]